jgi:hypothetical protein
LVRGRDRPSAFRAAVVVAVLIVLSLMPMGGAGAANARLQLPLLWMNAPTTGPAIGPRMIMASGRVVDAHGAVSGAAVVAFLDLQGKRAVQLPVAGHAITGADGRYMLSIAPTAAIATYGRSRGGAANFLILVVGRNGVSSSYEIIRGFDSRTRRWIDPFSQWSAPVRTSLIVGAPGVRQLDASRFRPDAPTPPCGQKNKYGNPWVSWNKINQHHTASSTSGYMKYGFTYTQSMGFMTAFSHSGPWNAGGQLSVSKNGYSNVTDTNITSNMNRWIRAKTIEQEYAVICVGNRVEPDGWAGDTDFYGSVGNAVNCRTVNDAYRVKYYPGHVQTKGVGNNRTESYNLTAAPVPGMLSVGLQATVNYGNTLEQRWVSSSGQHWLCGNGVSFPNAGVVYASDL